MRKILPIKIINICMLLLLFSNLSFSSERKQDDLVIQSTTSTRDSGFYKFILPEFEKLYKIKVKVVAYGTGQAIVNAKNCNADILIVHSIDDEIDFIKKGYGVDRENLMYNDFVIIGPKDDPLNITKERDIRKVFENISLGDIRFISRGDDSGTHKSEIRVWDAAEINPKNNNYNFYYESGQGMGSTINIAIGMNGYTYTDRATWLNFKNKLNHKILFEKDSLLFNQYGIIRVNKKICPNVNEISSKIFYDWMLSDHGKRLIESYKVKNKQLFFVR
tara:strand:- start:6712 stop:7539 length:828 start_codon:yes stop_codon:yes gene_type:complete